MRAHGNKTEVLTQNKNKHMNIKRDIHADLYPMHSFKLMYHIANFYADTPVRIGAFYHP